MRTPKKHRILFIVQELTSGGAAFLAIKLISKLIKYYDIDLLIAGPSDDALLEVLPTEVSVFKKLNTNSLTQRLRSIDSACPLYNLALFLNDKSLTIPLSTYQAVLGTSILASWQACAAFILSRSNKKILFLVDEALKAYPDDLPSKKTFTHLSIQASNHIVSVSKSLYDGMADYCPTLKTKPLTVIRPIVELKHFDTRHQATQLPRDKPVVMTIARLEQGKQIMESLYIHHQLKTEGIDFRWYIIGEGSLKQSLENGIKCLGMDEDFILAGFQHNVAHWLQQCDLFALLSASEGCPTVIMEALQLGCPVISTSVHGASEMIIHGKTGIIVPNDHDAIKHELCRLLLDRDLRNELKQNLIKNPFKTDSESNIKKLMHMIDQPSQELQRLPLVTIMIPTFNQASYLDKAISSALMQDFGSLEVIVSDDASTDGTQRLCQKWLHDPRFRYHRNDKNLGRVGNYQHALRNLARGDWALMLDGDDYLIDTNFISAAWASLRQHADKNALFVQAGHTVHFADCNQPDVDVLPAIAGNEAVMNPGQYPKFVYETGFFTHLGILFDRQAAILNNCYSANISASDMESFLRLSLQGPVILLNRIAGCWNQHGNNASSNVPVNEIAENARIFRNVAYQAICRGLISNAEIEPVLSRYEAHTIAYLFFCTIGKTSHHPLDTLRLIPIAISVNPQLLFNPTFLKAAAVSFKRLLIHMFKKIPRLT